MCSSKSCIASLSLFYIFEVIDFDNPKAFDNFYENIVESNIKWWTHANNKFSKLADPSLALYINQENLKLAVWIEECLIMLLDAYQLELY